MNVTDDVRADLLALIGHLITTIDDDDRSHPDDDEPGLCVTVGTDDGSRWGYQTGDNSFVGGAYGLKHWAVVCIGRLSLASDVVSDIFEQWADSAADY